MKKLNGVTAAVITLVATTSLANAQGMGPADLNPWQDCGLGSMVFPDNGVAAAISNVVWDLGTTAVSSAVSSPDQCAGSSVQVAAFVQLGYDHISRETVVGEGEYLQTLMDGLNCEPAVQASILADVRENFSTQLQDAEFVAKDGSGKAEAYFLGLREVVSTSYGGSCDSF